MAEILFEGDYQMNFYLPYEEKLFTSDGAYIKPDGSIIYPSKGHERFAQEYCNGKYFHELRRVHSDASKDYHDEFSISEERWKRLKDRLKYDGTREEVDPYLSSKLTKEQLKLYKLWIEQYKFTRNNFYSDFLVFVLGWDKVETIMQRAISTSSRIPHVRFFNYYLMGDRILVNTPQIYSEETGCFVADNTLNPYAVEEGSAVIELNETKNNVLKKDLKFFLK